ncbi:hypothetical protein BH23PAT2_BH23PAT2_04900 [soil metagenome]
MSNNHIELNGTTYDTRTGKIISSTVSKVTPRSSGVNVDGIARPKKNPIRTSPISVNTKTKQPQKSQTLMRHVVNKPKQLDTSQDSAPHAQPSVFQKRSFFNSSRFERAATATKSVTVQKFSHAQSALTRAIATTSSSKREIEPSPLPTIQPQQKTGTPMPAQPQQNVIERGLQKAQSHENEPVKSQSFIEKTAPRLRLKPATLKYSLVGLAIVVIAGFLIQLSVPRITMQLAATRAGISANLPDYKPTGFTLSSTVDYRPGHVALSYQSVSDNRSFRVSQTESDWTSDTLLKNFVEEKGLYQTIPDKGKTIYIYDGANATWVDGGIWYSVEGASSLNSEQLLRIANSL